MCVKASFGKSEKGGGYHQDPIKVSSADTHISSWIWFDPDGIRKGGSESTRITCLDGYQQP